MLKRNRLFLVLIVPGLLSALYLAAQRYSLETRNRRVELALDYTELQSLSVSAGMPVSDILARFRASGVTGVAITEQTLGDLSRTGQISYAELRSEGGPLTRLSISNQRLADRVKRALSLRLAPGMMSSGPGGLTVKAATPTLDATGIGLPPDSVETVRTAGLDIVARLQNYPSITPKAIDAAIADMNRYGITRLICAGEEVIGWRGLVPYAAAKLQASGLAYGSIEFGKQKGDARISEKLSAAFIRVHSISASEMATMTPGSIAERFTRAIKERNIRLCYVRLFESCGEDTVNSNARFVASVRDDIERAGYSVGSARPFGNRAQQKPFLALIGLSIAAAAVMTLNSLLSLDSGWKWAFLIGGAAILAAFSVKGEFFKQLAALTAALVFPTLAVCGVVGPYFRAEVGQKNPAAKALGLFIATSAFTLAGAAVVAGMLGTRPYMVKVEQFMGIKAAHLLPLLFVIFIMAAGLPILDRSFAEVRKKVSENLRAVFDHPLFVWHAIVVVFALVIVAVALMRTGNDSGMGVSGMELRFRAILDKLLVVRPRTKEFLIGHPALFLGIALLLSRRRAWGIPLVALGVLGQVSLLNTFCHIHSPLAMSALRAFNGLVIGLVIGWVLWIVIGKRIPEPPPDKV